MDALRRSARSPRGDPLATLAPAALGEELTDAAARGLGAARRRATRCCRARRPPPTALRRRAARPRAAAGAGARRSCAPILLSRHDPKLGLHRLRLTGELTEIRAADLGFTRRGGRRAAGDARRGRRRGRRREPAPPHRGLGGRPAARGALARPPRGAGALRRGVLGQRAHRRRLPDQRGARPPAHRGARARAAHVHPRPRHRAARRPADRPPDSARLLGAMEEANAFVVAVDVSRTWFRYHHLLTDLLRLELRARGARRGARAAPARRALARRERPPTDAIRHATLGEDWELATELLGRHWVRLLLDGEEATLRALLDGPAGRTGRRATRSWPRSPPRAALGPSRAGREADALLDAARDGHRRAAGGAGGAGARPRWAPSSSSARAGSVTSPRSSTRRAGCSAMHGAGAGPELQALALMNLGIAEGWTLRLAERRGASGARRSRWAAAAGSPYVEIGCLSALGVVATMRRPPRRGGGRHPPGDRIAERIGWTTHDLTGRRVHEPRPGADRPRAPRRGRGSGWSAPTRCWRGRAEPAASVGLRHAQGMLASLARAPRRRSAAFARRAPVEPAARRRTSSAIVARQWELRTLLRLGDRARCARRWRARPRGWTGDGAVAQPGGATVRLARGRPAAGAPTRSRRCCAGEAFVSPPTRRSRRSCSTAIARSRLGEHDAAHEQRRARARPRRAPGARVDHADRARRARAAGGPPAPPHGPCRAPEGAGRPSRGRRAGRRRPRSPPSRSASASSPSCASCPPTSRPPRSAASCSSRCTRSRRTCASSTRSSTCTRAPRRCSAPARSGCSRPRAAAADALHTHRAMTAHTGEPEPAPMKTTHYEITVRGRLERDARRRRSAG